MRPFNLNNPTLDISPIFTLTLFIPTPLKHPIHTLHLLPIHKFIPPTMRQHNSPRSLPIHLHLLHPPRSIPLQVIQRGTRLRKLLRPHRISRQPEIIRVRFMNQREVVDATDTHNVGWGDDTRVGGL